MNETLATAANHLAALVPLAQDLDENKVTPGILGFIVFAVIGGATWMLMKSMNKQFKRIDFEEAPAGPAAGATAKAPAEPSAGDAASKTTATATEAARTPAAPGSSAAPASSAPSASPEAEG